MSENHGDHLWILGLVLFFSGLAMAVAGGSNFERLFGIGKMPVVSWSLIALGYPCALTGLITIVISVIRSEKH